jgi:putative membrane protein insertion efficiency factor
MPDRLLARLLLRLIAAYRYLLSPWVGNACRYWPTCSEYAQEAIEQHGAARGSYLAARRLARCHPYGPGGVDPVPHVFSWRCRCNDAAGASNDRMTASASRDA